MMFGLGLPELIVITAILLFLCIPAYFVARILNKAGFSGWYSLLCLLPVINVICLWVFAFIEWPIEKRNI
jgi:uncharacterized membrane protein YhaH (DUF805 family)